MATMTETSQTPDPTKAHQAALNVIAAVRSGQCDPRHAADMLGLSYDQDMIMAVLERAAVDIEAMRQDARRWRYFARLWFIDLESAAKRIDAEIAALSPEAQAALDRP